MVVAAGCAHRLSINSEAPPAMALFADAVSAESPRLTAAREAMKSGDRERAIHEYLASVQEDPATADTAIGELVEVYLLSARAASSDGRYVDESAGVKRCYQTLQQISQADSATKALPRLAREVLFRELGHVRAVGHEAASSHVQAADHLRHDAKGRHWWNDDDEDKQAEALHRVNLAWSYYPAFSDECTVNRMYDIWADMKGELPTWQYNQVMERDRLHLGRVVGDQSQ